MSATNEELENMAKELYKELGGLRTKNGRIVRALLHKFLYATALEMAGRKVVNSREGTIARPVALAELAALLTAEK